MKLVHSVKASLTNRGGTRWPNRGGTGWPNRGCTRKGLADGGGPLGCAGILTDLEASTSPTGNGNGNRCDGGGLLGCAGILTGLVAAFGPIGKNGSGARIFAVCARIFAVCAGIFFIKGGCFAVCARTFAVCAGIFLVKGECFAGCAGIFDDICNITCGELDLGGLAAGESWLDSGGHGSGVLTAALLVLNCIRQAWPRA